MSSLSADLRRFILTSIPSVPHLEAALLLHALPGQGRTATEVALRLYVPQRVAEDVLKTLCAGGILRCDDAAEPRYRFEPGDAALDPLLDELARTYADDLVGVTRLIHDATQKQAQRFADAFRLRKDK
jgi:hypothetical protein